PPLRRRCARGRWEARAHPGAVGRTRLGAHCRSPRALARRARRASLRLKPMAASAATATAVVNALTIDVEDYFQVSALAPYIARTEWDVRECRVEHNVERILCMLEDYGARATFFTLGWIAERYPQLVRRIVDNGHELASHGFAHKRATQQRPEAFFSD